MVRRAIVIGAGVLAAWLVLLLVLGVVFEGRTARSVAERFGASLQGDASFERAELALIRGRLELERVAVRRTDTIGTLTLDVAGVTCELAPIGIALIDRGCRELRIEGMRLEASTIGLFKLRKIKRTPILTDRVVIADAVIGFAPSGLIPGIGRIAIRIDRAVAGPTRFRTPLSWIFAMEELSATLELPAGIAVHLRYQDGVMAASGSVFGSTPVAVPIALPVRDAADDGRRELEKLVGFGKEMAERLVARRARDWLRSKL